MAGINGYTIEEVIKAIYDAHGLLAPTSRILGCTRQTVYNYAKRYATVRQAIDEARDTTLDFAEQQLMKAVKAGSVPAIMFLLKTVGKSRGYVERQELTGADGGAIEQSVMIYVPDNGRNDGA